MVPRSHSEDSEPVLEVSAVGTANADGDYVQHEAVAPHKAHAALADPFTVVVREGQGSPMVPSGSDASNRGEPCGLVDAAPAAEETTSVTKSRNHSSGLSLYRVLTYVEHHRTATLSLAVGTLLILFAAVLAIR